MKNSLPIIGISGQWNVTQELITMRPSYIAALENAGAIPMIIPVTENRRTLDFYIENCDALLLSGGQDIQPHLYGEELQPHCGELVPVRDRVESYIFERAMALDKVLFGICRGFQMVNVACGGTLFQDLAIDFGTELKHRMQEPFNREAHMVTAVPGTPLADLLGTAPFAVNSVHHQGAKVLGKDYKTYCILGDGECDEGSNWEAGMSAAHFKADNLISFVDRNKCMIDGRTEDVMRLEPLADKWRSFGFEVIEVDGHNMNALADAIDTALATKGKPTMIIADTIKGCGVDYMEDDYKWHYGALNEEKYEQAKESLEKHYAKRVARAEKEGI